MLQLFLCFLYCMLRLCRAVTVSAAAEPLVVHAWTQHAPSISVVGPARRSGEGHVPVGGRCAAYSKLYYAYLPVYSPLIIVVICRVSPYL